MAPQRTISPGIVLADMVLSPEEISPDATVLSEGFVDSPSISSYQQILAPAAQIMDIGSSKVINVSTTLTLENDEAIASTQVLLLQNLGPESFAQIAGGGFDLQAGFEAESIVFETVDWPQVGDISTAMLMRIETAFGNFDSFILFFAQGTVSGRLVFVGPQNGISLEDLFGPAKLLAARIRDKAP